MLGMFDAADIAGIERTIQLAIAPAFLLTSLAGLLAVLTQRLARLVDRERALREGAAHPVRHEVALLGQRQRLVNRAIFWCVTAMVLLCLMIVVSFIGLVFELLAAFIVAAMMMAAMGALILALLCFLAEVRLAARIIAHHDDLAARHGG